MLFLVLLSSIAFAVDEYTGVTTTTSIGNVDEYAPDAEAEQGSGTFLIIIAVLAVFISIGGYIVYQNW